MDFVFLLAHELTEQLNLDRPDERQSPERDSPVAVALLAGVATIVSWHRTAANVANMDTPRGGTNRGISVSHLHFDLFFKRS